MSIAFFDVDGTLLPHPSLERRFFWRLVKTGNIPPSNCLRWAGGMARLADLGSLAAWQSNKMYLRGVRSCVFSETEPKSACWLPEFFPSAIQRIWWHASRGDLVVLVTGTLAPIAEIVRLALERELLWRGIESRISAIATQPVSRDGRFTGEVNGALMFGGAKAAAVRKFASARSIPLSQCFAYGDHWMDGAMLQAVGNPVAVNPDARLRRTALRNGWVVTGWRPHPHRAARLRDVFKWKGQAAQ